MIELKKKLIWIKPGLTKTFEGDFVVEVRPVGAGTGANGVSGHRGSPRRAPRASLPAFNPSRKTRPYSYSRGAVGRAVPKRLTAMAGRLGEVVV